MAFVEKEAISLTISTPDVDDTDEDKTPEYPLSDDHPLSLKNRSFLLQNSTLASRECEMTTRPKQQSGTQTLSTRAQTTSPPIQTTSYDRIALEYEYQKSEISQKRDESTGVINTSKAFPEAQFSTDEVLEAQVHDSKEKNSMKAFSFHDCPAENTVANTSRSRPRLPGTTTFGGKESKHLHEQITPLSTLTDTNNNAGTSQSYPDNGYQIPSITSPVAKMVPNESDHSKKLSEQQDDTSNQRRASKLEDNAVSNITTKSKEMSIYVDFDPDETNVPPQLSPAINTKSVVGMPFHRLSFPPILTPVKNETSCDPLTHENPPISNVHSIKQESRGQNLLKSQPEEESQVICRDENHINGELPKCSNSETVIMCADVDNVDMESNNQKTDNVLKEKEESFPPSQSSNEGCSREGQKKADVIIQSRADNPTSQIPFKKPTEKSCQLHKSQCPPTKIQTVSDISEECVSVCLSKTDSSFDTQLYLSTDAKTVTSGKSYLCYPYSGQNVSAGGKPEVKDHKYLGDISMKHTIITSSHNINKEQTTSHMKAQSQNEGHKASQDSVAKTNASTQEKMLPSSSSSMPLSFIPFPSLHNNPDTQVICYASLEPVSKENQKLIQTSHETINSKSMSTSIALLDANGLEASLDNPELISASSNKKAHQGFIGSSGQAKSGIQKSIGTTSHETMHASTYSDTINLQGRTNEKVLRRQESRDFSSPIKQGEGYKGVETENALTSASSNDPFSPQISHSQSQENSKLKSTARNLKSRRESRSSSQDIPHDKNSISNSNRSEPDINLRQTDVSGLLENGQLEPLDLSSKHSTSPQKDSLNLHNAKAKKGQDKRCMHGINRCNGYDERPEAELSQLSRICARQEKSPGDMCLPEVKRNVHKTGKTGSCKNDSRLSPDVMSRDKIDSERKIQRSVSWSGRKSFQMVESQDGSRDITLLHQPNVVVNIDDDDSEILSPQKVQTRTSKEVLENRLPSANPDDKTYSHLAYAAILSKGKKPSMSCDITSEIENINIFDFLRRDKGKMLEKEKTLTHSNACSSTKSRLRNGDYIDLTEDNEDVLSVSSDEGIKKINIASNLGCLFEAQRIEHYITEEKNTLVTVANAQPFYGSLHGLDSNSMKFSDHEIRDNTSKDSKERERIFEIMPVTLDENSPIYSHSVPSPQLDQEPKMAPLCQELLSCLDSSQICHIKEQTLTFSRHQKAMMARKIKDIISKNSSLLPEGIHPLQTSLAAALTKSHRLHMPQIIDEEKAPIFKSEIKKSQIDCNSILPERAFEGKDNSFLGNGKTQSPGSDNAAQMHVQKTIDGTNFHFAFDNQHPSPNAEASVLDTGLTRIASHDQTQTPAQTPITSEPNEKLHSSYKTVWQTQFITESNEYKFSNKSLKYNHSEDGEIAQRLQLMHNAANKINSVSQSSNSQRNQTGNSHPPRKRRRRENQEDRTKDSALDSPTTTCVPTNHIGSPRPPVLTPASVHLDALHAPYIPDHHNGPPRPPVPTPSSVHLDALHAPYIPDHHIGSPRPPVPTPASVHLDALHAPYIPDHHIGPPRPPVPTPASVHLDALHAPYIPDHHIGPPRPPVPTPASVHLDALHAPYIPDHHIGPPRPPVPTPASVHLDALHAPYIPDHHIGPPRPPVPTPASVHLDALHAPYIPDHHVDFPHSHPTSPGAMNQFLPSPFVVAPCYAMAYPLCYPTFQATTAPNQPIVLSPHSKTLDVVENSHLHPGGNNRTRTRRSKSFPESPGRKKKPRHRGKKKNSISTIANDAKDISKPIPRYSPISPPEENTTGDAMIQSPEEHDKRTSSKITIDNIHATDVSESDTLQYKADVSESDTLQYKDTLLEILKPSSNTNDRFHIQTRIEAGHTVLSIQDNNVGKLLPSDSRTDGCDGITMDQSTLGGNCRIDLENVPSDSARMESPAIPRFSSSLMTPNLFHNSISTVSEGRNLDALAWASESHEQMKRFGSLSSVSGPDTGTNIVLASGGSITNASTILPGNTHCPEVNLLRENALNQIQVLETPSCNENGPVNNGSRRPPRGITEKEKAVTEMLAAMMQSRNLNPTDKNDEKK